MLKPKTLTQILSQANTGGVSNTLLFNKDGRLLAYACPEDQEVRTISAIASGIWTSYCNYGKNVLADSPLRHVYIEAEDGCAIVSTVADVLLCLYSSVKVNPGILKLKMKTLIEHLGKPLSELSGF